MDRRCNGYNCRARVEESPYLCDRCFNAFAYRLWDNVLSAIGGDAVHVGTVPRRVRLGIVDALGELFL